MERGSATLLTTLVIVVLVFGAVIGAVAQAMRAHGSKVTGAADLVALAGAQAQWSGGSACDAARRAGVANGVHVESCEVAGDEVEFVVSVGVKSEPTKLVGSIRATAHAGAITGSPE